jgi:hypothetical protein
MRIEKERRKVNIICHGTFLVRGLIHINPGERILDFINDSRESFIAVTEVEFYRTKENNFLSLGSKPFSKKASLVLNKAAIIWMEEA